MNVQKRNKLNHILGELNDTRLVSSRWLRAHGYSNSLVARYVERGWLMSPARGVYMRRGGRLQWDGVVRSLQAGEGLPLHVGGRFALSLSGIGQGQLVGNGVRVTLYGPGRPPGWLGKLSLQQPIEWMGMSPFDQVTVPFTTEASESVLSEAGLAWHSTVPGCDAVVSSTPERAMLEVCSGVGDGQGVYEADALMQAMTDLLPSRVTLMLWHCRSIKAKRLFLALANRHRHAWLEQVPLDGVDLGRGKRALVLGGRLHPVYQITLPGDLLDPVPG